MRLMYVGCLLVRTIAIVLFGVCVFFTAYGLIVGSFTVFSHGAQGVVWAAIAVAFSMLSDEFRSMT